jgi:hypothetical protein
MTKKGKPLNERAGVGVRYGKDIDRGFLIDDGDFMLIYSP